MGTLTTRTLSEIDTIQLFDPDAGMHLVGTIDPTGCNSGHMTLHLILPGVSYMIDDAHKLAIALSKHGYRLDSNGYMAVSNAMIDRFWADRPIMFAPSHHSLEVTALHNTGCNLVFHLDLTTLAASVRVLTVGTYNPQIRLDIYKITSDTYYNSRKPLTHTSWGVHTLSDMRKVLDIFGYELSYAAEDTLMKVLIPIP